MKRMICLGIAVFMGLFVNFQKAYAVEDLPFFGDPVQWNQTERLRVELFGRYIITSNTPVQYGRDRVRGDKNSPRHEEGLMLQYRLSDDPLFGKLEIGVSMGVGTRDDTYDNLQVRLEIADTLFDRVRIGLGRSEQVNIGRVAGADRALEATYIVLGIKMFENTSFLVTANGRYNLASSLPSRITEVYDADKKNPLRAELGPQIYWRAHQYLTMFAAPSVSFDDNFKPSMVGLKSGLQWQFGKQFLSPMNPFSHFSFYIGEEWKANTGNMKKTGFNLGMGIIYRF